MNGNEVKDILKQEVKKGKKLTTPEVLYFKGSISFNEYLNMCYAEYQNEILSLSPELRSRS
mgnify:CR=1 FL=1